MTRQVGDEVILAITDDDEQAGIVEHVYEDGGVRVHVKDVPAVVWYLLPGSTLIKGE